MIERNHAILVRSLFQVSDASRVVTEQTRNSIDDRADRRGKSPGREPVGGPHETKTCKEHIAGHRDSHKSNEEGGNGKVNRKNHNFDVRDDGCK